MASPTERIGVCHCGEIAERNNWMFREQPVDDVGIDAHMEFIESSGKPKQLLALQIKSGASWFKEKKDGYELEIDLPGFTKEEVTAELKDGYLTISAAKGLDKDEQEKETGKYIRRERYAGACQRSFYVGEDVTEQDIKAEFKHGMLKLFVPKKEAKPAVETKKYVTIEG